MPTPNTHISTNYKAALLECFVAATALVPVRLRPHFILIGGAASVVHGSHFKTADVDVAASTEALACFRKGVELEGSRFTVGPCETIEFDCRRLDIKIPIEIVELGGSHVESIAAIEPFEEGFVASPADLIYNRAETVVGRGDDGDVADFNFLVGMAAMRGVLIPPRGEEWKETLLEAAKSLGWVERYVLGALMIT